MVLETKHRLHIRQVGKIKKRDKQKRRNNFLFPHLNLGMLFME